MPTPKPKKTFTFAIADDMKAALTHIRERDGIAEAEQIRRGVQMWLNSKGVKRADRLRASRARRRR